MPPHCDVSLPSSFPPYYRVVHPRFRVLRRTLHAPQYSSGSQSVGTDEDARPSIVPPPFPAHHNTTIHDPPPGTLTDGPIGTHSPRACTCPGSSSIASWRVHLANGYVDASRGTGPRRWCSGLASESSGLALSNFCRRLNDRVSRG